MRKTSFLAILGFFAFGLVPSLAQQRYPFNDPALPMEKRIDNLSITSIYKKLTTSKSALGIKQSRVGESFGSALFMFIGVTPSI